MGYVSIFGSQSNNQPSQPVNTGNKGYVSIFSNNTPQNNNVPFSSLKTSPQGQVATPVVGKPLQVNPLQQIGTTIGNTAQQVIKGITFTFKEPSLVSPIPQSQMVKEPTPTAIQEPSSATMKFQTPQVGKPLLSDTGNPVNSLGTTFSQGSAPTVWDKVTQWFNDISGNSAVDQKAAAMNAYAIAKDPQAQKTLIKNFGTGGVLPNGQVNPQVLTELAKSGGNIATNSPMEQISQELGIRSMPTSSEFTQLLLTGTLGLGLAEAPLATIKAVGIFGGVNAIQTGLIKALTGGKGSTLSDVVPIENPTIKNVIDVVDFLALGAVTHGIMQKSPTVFDALTKDVITKYNLPQTVTIDSKDLLSLGNKSANDALKTLNISSEELTAMRKAALKGESTTIQTPTTQITKLVDKPYWGKVKDLFNIPQTDETLSTSQQGTGKKITSIAGLLPSGEATPKDVISTVFQAKAETTPEGKAIIKAASEAQQKGMNIIIDKESEQALSSSETAVKTVPIDQIETGLSEYITKNANTNTPKIQEYTQTLKNGEALEPIPAYEENGKYILNKDGFHRLQAYKNAGIDQVAIRIEPKTTLSASAKQRVENTQNQPSHILNDITDALYSGDPDAAKALHDLYTSDGHQLPKFEDLKAEVSKYHEYQSGQLDSLMNDLKAEQRLGEKNNPEDPTNQLLDIAETLKKHFNAPGARYKLTGTERTYTSVDGYSMRVGGKYSDVIDRLFYATDIDGFGKNIKILADKFDKTFTDIYSRIKSGAIDGGDYESFKERFSETNRNNQSIIGKNKSNAENKTDKVIASSPEDSNAIQGGTNERTIIGDESSNNNAGNATNPESLTNGESGSRTISAENSESDLGSEHQLGSVTLNAGINPGLDKFLEEDISPLLTSIKEAAGQAYDVVNPPRASEIANKSSNIVREALAKIENYESLITGKFQSYKKFFSNYSDAENIANISQYERTGQFLEEPKAKAGQPSYSQLYHDSMVESYKVIRAAYGKDEEGFIENYVRRAFSFPDKEQELKGKEALTNFSKSLSANKSPLKQRVLDMPLDEAFKDMQDRGIKVKMNTTNPEELRQWSLINAKRALVYKGAWNDLKVSKLITFVGKGGKRPDGFVPLQDRAAEVFAPAEAHFGVGEGVSEKGYKTVIPVGKYYADPTVARIMNNVISSGLEEIKLFKAARVLSNQMNSFQLGLSAFHLTGTSINAGISDVALGLRNILQGKPLQALPKIGRGLVPGVSFARDLYHGQKFMENLKRDDPEAMRIIDELINPAGGRIGRDQKYEDALATKVKTSLANGNYLGAAVRVPGAIVESVAHPLLNYSIPRVKIGAFMDLAQSVISRLPEDASYNDKQTALARAWNSIDNRFGQLVYSNLFWNKVGKDLAMLSTRSVGWNLGDLRELGGGVLKDPIKTMLAGRERVSNNFSERFSDRMLFSISLILVTSVLGAIYQYLHTGQTPNELKDYFFPKDGGVDSAGNPTRRSLPTYWKDVYAFSTNPLGTIGNKVSPGLATFLQLWNNKDYYGNLIRNPNDPAGTQLEQAGAYMLQNILPFSVQSAVQPNQTTEQKVEGFLGITKAPASIVQSDKQKAAIQAYQNQVGLPSPKTPEQVATQNLRTKAYEEIKTMGKNSPSYKELIKNGTLNTPRKRELFLRNAKLNSTQRMIQHLPKSVRKTIGK